MQPFDKYWGNEGHGGNLAASYNCGRRRQSQEFLREFKISHPGLTN
jgi:hypothetical protein